MRRIPTAYLQIRCQPSTLTLCSVLMVKSPMGDTWSAKWDVGWTWGPTLMTSRLVSWNLEAGCLLKEPWNSQSQLQMSEMVLESSSLEVFSFHGHVIRTPSYGRNFSEAIIEIKLQRRLEYFLYQVCFLFTFASHKKKNLCVVCLLFHLLLAVLKGLMIFTKHFAGLYPHSSYGDVFMDCILGGHRHRRPGIAADIKHNQNNWNLKMFSLKNSSTWNLVYVTKIKRGQQDWKEQGKHFLSRLLWKSCFCWQWSPSAIQFKPLCHKSPISR